MDSIHLNEICEPTSVMHIALRVAPGHEYADLNEEGEPPFLLQMARKVAPGHEWLRESMETSRVEDNDQVNPSILCRLESDIIDANGLGSRHLLDLLEPPALIDAESTFAADQDIPSPASVTNIGSTCTDDIELISSVETENLKVHLVEAKRQARIRRWRISAPCLVVGLSACVSGEMVSVYAFTFHDRGHVLNVIGQSLIAPGVVIYLLALLPTDQCATRFTIRVMLVLHVLLIVVGVRTATKIFNEISNDQCKSAGFYISCSIAPYRMLFNAVYLLVNAFVTYRYGRSLFLTPMAMSHMLWFVTGLSLLNQAVWWVSFLILDIVNSLHSLLAFDTTLVVVYLACGVLALWPNLRLYAQAWLATQDESAASAAGVAVLLGASSIQEIMNRSKKTFCAVSAEKLTTADMADNLPNPTLRQHTEKAKLGQVDAFVSHSWHDDSEAKWKELQDWREKFKRKHGREPLLWIDKYCVDQTDLDNSLSCLPVYLAGCRRMLVLCGTTYLQRLWCLVEIFTFKEMGGLQSNLECRLLTKESIESEKMKKEIEKFDVYKARCFQAHDTMRLLAVMEAGAASLDDLRDWIQSSVRAALSHS